MNLISRGAIALGLAFIGVCSAAQLAPDAPSTPPDGASEARPEAGGEQPVPRPASKPATAGVRFAHVDLFADSGSQPLAAYQVEVSGTIEGGVIVLVGVEGGEKAVAAFSGPPFYDPDALTRDRVVLAAFTPSGERGLPTGRVRVARLHVQLLLQDTGGQDQRPASPSFSVRLIAAGNASGERISAAFTAELSAEE